MLFMTMPTIAETIAPDTPPPTSWPTRAPISMPPVAPCSIGISDVRSDPPAAPPRAPAMVLPAVPKFTFFAAAPTALPPIAPAMSWMIRLIMVPDMAFPPLWPQNHRGDTTINCPGTSCLVFALFWSQVNHCAAMSRTRLRDFANREIQPTANSRHSARKITCRFDAHMKGYAVAAGLGLSSCQTSSAPHGRLETLPAFLLRLTGLRRGGFPV